MADSAHNNFNWDPYEMILTVAGRLLCPAVVGPFMSPVNMGIIYYDSATNRFKASENGGAPVNLLTGGGGGSAYTNIDYNGTPLPQETVINVQGTALTATDNPGVATNITLSQSPGGSTSVVGTGRLINTTAPITGGGDLSADRTIAIPQANGSTNGYLSSADWTTFNSKGSGSVTSVAFTAPAEFTVAGSPITSSGTISLTKTTQTANLFWASPNGSSGAPVFRNIVNADLPTSGVTAGSYTLSNITVNAQGIVTAASNGSMSGTFPTARASNSSATAIANATQITVGFNTTDWDTAGTIHNNVTNNSRLTIPTTGYYQITAYMGFTTPTTSGTVNMQLAVNGVAIPTAQLQVPMVTTNQDNAFIGTWIEHATAGDYFELLLYQNTGAGNNYAGTFGLVQVS